MPFPLNGLRGSWKNVGQGLRPKLYMMSWEHLSYWRAKKLSKTPRIVSEELTSQFEWPPVGKIGQFDEP